jgi:hypothetical protein
MLNLKFVSLNEDTVRPCNEVTVSNSYGPFRNKIRFILLNINEALKVKGKFPHLTYNLGICVIL